MHFTDISIRSLKAGTYFDNKTPSFGIRVGKNRKTWIVLKGPNRTKVRLGHYPALSLADARRKAFVALGSPLLPVSAPSFQEALEQFLSQDRWRPRAKYEISRTLRRHFHWEKTLDKITHNDVATIIENIEAKSEASHALKDIRTFFNWCIPKYLPHSPCNGLKAPARDRPRVRVLTDDELQRVWQAADSYPFGIIVRLLILTGQRKGEIAALHWEWVDENKRTITFPASITKNGREHCIPFGQMTYELLDGIANISVLTFPGRKTDQLYNGWGKHKAQLDDRSGVSNWTLHDLRRTFATNLAALDVPPHVTEKLLNHASGTISGVAAIYNRFQYADEMRAAIEAWETRLGSLLKAKPRQAVAR